METFRYSAANGLSVYCNGASNQQGRPGEGKTSLNTKVIADATSKTIALDNYAATPILFQGVKK